MLEGRLRVRGVNASAFNAEPRARGTRSQALKIAGDLRLYRNASREVAHARLPRTLLYNFMMPTFTRPLINGP